MAPYILHTFALALRYTHAATCFTRSAATSALLRTLAAVAAHTILC